MYAAAQSHFFLDRIAIQCSVSGMVPPTVAKSSHLDECNQDDHTQPCPKTHLPQVILGTVKLTITRRHEKIFKKNLRDDLTI